MGRLIRTALIGAGFIGTSHALALGAVNATFGREKFEVEATVLADADAAKAEVQAHRFGFVSWTTNWRTALADCDALILAVPSFMHREIALEALSQGKHLLCEKPVGLSAAEADEIVEAATRAGVTHGVGLTYLRAPMVRHAKALLDSGALGRPLHFRGRHNEDYLADRAAPFSWRLDPNLAGHCGALGDLGWHILSIARLLCGPVSGLSGQVEIFHRARPEKGDPETQRPVGNEDWAALTLRFENGATGLVESSRIAHGRKMDIGFELVCENGTLALDGERLNELHIYRAGEDPSASGFRRVLINADHPDYGAFIPAPAHGLSFNDLKTIELADFFTAIADERPATPDLTEAVLISRICEAVLASSSSGQWIASPELNPKDTRKGLMA